MISNSFIAIFIFLISLASHATASCDWLLLSEQVKESEQILLKDVEARWRYDLENFQSLPSKEDQEDFLREYSAGIEKQLKARARRTAMHFNLHGGHWLSYLKDGGIRATRGDSGLAYGFSKDYRDKVYNFNLESIDLYTALTTRNPHHIFFRKRMGDTVVLFDLDSEILQLYRKSGLIQTEDEITINFDEQRDGSVFFGVPYRSFITHPLRLFDGAHKSMGPRWLSYNEQTYFALIMIEESLRKPWSW